jgi:hypothetical protein
MQRPRFLHHILFALNYIHKTSHRELKLLFLHLIFNTHISVLPQSRAVRSDTRIPLIEVSRTDLELLLHIVAELALGRLVPLLTATDTPRLRRLRVANLTARWLGRRSGRRLGRRWRRLAGRVSDDAHADIRVGPQPAARLAAHLRVPRQELRQRDARLVGDRLAAFCAARGDKVEGVAVAHHAGLRGQRRRNAVAGWGRLCAGRGRCGRLRGRAGRAGDADAVVCLCPDAAAVAAYSRVPLDEVGDAERAVLLGDLLAVVVGHSKVEGGARVNEAVLGGRQFGRAGGRACGRCGRGSEWCSWGAWNTNTVVCLCPDAAAVTAYSRVPLDEVGDAERAVLLGDLLAVVVGHSEVEGGARVNETFQGGRRLGRTGGCRCGCRGSDWRSWSARDADAIVSFCPDTAAIVANGRVPRDELRHREGAKFFRNFLTVVVGYREVEVGAGIDQPILSRGWLGHLGGRGRCSS